MTDKMSTERVKSKIEWEGRLRDTLEYGLDGAKFEDPTLGAAWNAARACYDVATDRWSDDSQTKINVVADLLGE